MNAQPQIRLADWLMIATLGFTWGGTFLITEIALNGLSPFWLAASRIWLGALATFVIWQGRGGALFLGAPGQPIPTLTVCAIGALSTAVPFMLLAWGQQFVTSGFAGVSMAAVALIVLPLSHFLVPGERMSLRRTAGFLVGFVGVVILIGGQAFESTGNALELPGRIACIGAATCYAVSSVLLRRLPPVDPIGLSCVLLFIGAGVVTPVALIVEGLPPAIDRQTLAVIVLLGLVPTAAANLLRVVVVRRAGPVFTGLVNYQVPVWSVVLGAVFLAEPLPPSLIWAMALILFGVCLSQWGALNRLFARP